MVWGWGAVVSITETHIDYDHFPSITLYKKRGGELRKKNGEKREEGKISIIKMELVSELQSRITFLPFHFQIVQDYCHIYIICDSAHTAANALLACVLRSRNRDISLYGLHLLL